MILQGISELVLIGVHERGIPNKERIVLRANDRLQMGQFGLLLGVKGAPGFAFPIKDNFFWFGEGMVDRGDYVFVFTGSGNPQKSELPNSSEKLYTVFWGRAMTLFMDPNVVPILMRIDALTVDNPQQLLPPGSA